MSAGVAAPLRPEARPEASATGIASRAEVEDFLYHEAALLDEWKVEAWAALFTDDGEYMIPPTDDPRADPKKTLFLVYDDRHRLAERGKRLMSKAAHAEFPHSRTVHQYSNVRVAAGDGGETLVRCAFNVVRSKGPISETYPGHMVFRLVRIDGALRIRLKRAELALEVLRPHGKVSIIL